MLYKAEILFRGCVLLIAARSAAEGRQRFGPPIPLPRFHRAFPVVALLARALAVLQAPIAAGSKLNDVIGHGSRSQTAAKVSNLAQRIAVEDKLAPGLMPPAVAATGCGSAPAIALAFGILAGMLLARAPDARRLADATNSLCGPRHSRPHDWRLQNSVLIDHSRRGTHQPTRLFLAQQILDTGFALGPRPINLRKHHRGPGMVLPHA